MTREERIKRQIKYHQDVEKAWALAKESGEEVEFIRAMVLKDVYFLLYYVLERKDICYEEWWENETVTIEGEEVRKGKGDFICKDEDGNDIYDPVKGYRWRYYRPFLFERCGEVQAHPDGYLDIWARDFYKDLDDRTPLWTLDGWKTQGTVQVGDYVMTPNGLSKVVAVKHFIDSHCKKIVFNHNTHSIVCGNGHLWKINQWNAKRVDGNKRVGWEESVVETGKIKNSYRNPYIAIPDAYEMTSITLPVNPYALGVWLGDGHSACGRITNPDHEVWDRLEELGFKLSENQEKNRNVQMRNVYGLMEDLRHIGVLNNKHIPTIYMCASKEDRYELLRGLMDTDGSCSKDSNKNGCVFVNQNKNLVDDFRALCASLGIKTSVCTQKTWCGSTSYYVKLSVRPEHDRIFYVERKQSRINKDIVPQKQSKNHYIARIEEYKTVPTTCIQIEDPEGMYYVGHDMIQTHNSTIISYAMTIQEILKNPEITICIYSYNATLAQKLLGQIRNSLEGNQLLLACFPDILFKNTNVLSYKDENGEVHKMVWSNDCFNVKRKGNPKEHTVEASGLVVGQKIGGHYNLLIYDDTVVPESVFTKQQIEKTTSQFEMSLNTGSTANMRIRVIGTRYALGDTYEQMLKDKTVKLRQYACYDENGESRLYSDVILKWKLSKMHGSVVATQMYCDPQANSVFQFSMDWIPTRLPKTEIKKDFYNWYIICDPASKVSDDADNTVFLVIGVVGKGEDKHFLVADLIRDKLSLERKQKILFDLVSEFTNSRSKPTVFYERVSMQSDIQHYQTIMNQTGYHFTILEASGKPKINYGMTSVGSNLKYKDLRISALQPLLKQGKVSFVEGAIHENWKGEQEDMLNSFFEEEYAYYPNSKNDDVLDALSRIADLDVGAQLSGCDINEIRRKKEKKKEEHTINYFSENRYQPF